MAIALRVLRSPPEAEEIVQETFLELWRRASQYDGARGAVGAYVVTIAGELVMVAPMSKGRQPAAAAAAAAAATAAESDSDPAAEPEFVNDCVEKVP